MLLAGHHAADGQPRCGEEQEDPDEKQAATDLGERHGYSTDGRGVAGPHATAMLADSRPGAFAVMVMAPSSRVPCTMAKASPLNRWRVAPLSDSWLLGSPLPTPISLPL